MALINFKEKIQILLKLKESLIPQIDGNFIKNWELEALNYQNTSENIMCELKNVNFIEGLVDGISSQLSYLRINLQNYENMLEDEKDKFKRLYVLAALGLIAKLKLILFFSTYINSRKHKNSKNFPVMNESVFNAEQNNTCENIYDENQNKIEDNSYENDIHNIDLKGSSIFTNIEEQYSQLRNCTQEYKEKLFNAMAFNALAHYNAHINNPKNTNNDEYIDKNTGIYSNNIENDSRNNNELMGSNINCGVNDKHLSTNIGSNIKINTHIHNNSNNYNTHFVNNMQDNPINVINNFNIEKNERVRSNSSLISKKKKLQLPQSQNKTTNFLKSSQPLNGIKNNQSQHIINNYNDHLNNETHRYAKQNQDKMSNYLTNVHNNINTTNNDNSQIINNNTNLNKYYKYENNNNNSNNTHSENIMQPYNNEIYEINDNTYKNCYYMQ
ncbi:conserved protein, unknown function [Plasmodium yoelii]|uniref:Uncharacterized protein n=3 Tax=Plasmodium yoelii TaxID=5861 RepID=A0AAE9WZV1_PLAYO|nr:conserved protein, unknown function [Plasmodium yoelii]EAA19075.1 hypothetical protein [Plasmodium yoelii yoelii]WBY59477.1 hypothetical protein Py17XNL_001205284 [Plasmodium yoelii yoelii]CDU19595.1 conserved Plasmodium protein, unknown function [Plasmodium yoelii]VTZ80231.1 conserved protein, unknown function [Plasmodium yoelii]|eukprot:XP_727510.1 conserved protein, unknown function [Plasmodium yoelii]